MILQYYRFSILFSIVAIAFSFLFWGWQIAFTVIALGIIEISLSFDNATVNARVLKNWDHKWRQRFLFWGIVVAVFGMRILCPLTIVSITTGLSPLHVTHMALYAPNDYAFHLLAAHHQVAGFGGAFLFMIALAYFLEEKQVYWWEAVEQRLTRLGQMEGLSAAFVLLMMALLSNCFPNHQKGLQFFVAGVWGVISFIFVHGLGSLLGDDEKSLDSPLAPVIKAGITGFLYLEIQDAAFSGDGVMGAFVLTNYLPVIALGLAIGAFFVRSMTIHLVEAKTLSEYRYLEHGAFYSILVLAAVMWGSGLDYNLPQWAVGLTSVSLIAAAVGSSIAHNKKAGISEANPI